MSKSKSVLPVLEDDSELEKDPSCPSDDEFTKLLSPPTKSLSSFQESLDQLLFGGRWALPMVHGGPFWGVLTAPFSHSDWSHLVSNSLWFLPLSYLVLLNGVRAYVAVWIGVYATAAMVWLWLPVASHGLSGVVYGLLAYLLLIGWLEKRPLSVILSLGCLLAYGGLLPALLPFLNPPGVSWMGHISGFVGGLIAAVAVQRRPSPPELLR